MLWFQPIFAKLTIGAEGIDISTAHFTFQAGGFSALVVAVCGALVVAIVFEAKPGKQRVLLSLTSLASSLVLGGAYSTAAQFVYDQNLIVLPAFYYAVPIVAGALAVLPPWLIIRSAKRHARKPPYPTLPTGGRLGGDSR